MVSIGRKGTSGGFGGLAFTYGSTSSSDGSHRDPNGPADPLGMEILEL